MIARTHTFLFFGIFTVCLFTAPAFAGTVSSVGSPTVTKGKTKAEIRAGYAKADDNSSQDERLRFREQIDHGLTDWYALRLVLQQDDRKGDNIEHGSIGLSNRFYILEAEKYGFDFGLRVEYTHADGDKTPHSVATGLYELVPMGEYELRMNQLFSHDVGEDANDGVGAELRFQLTREISETHRLGLESFNDFGNLSELSGYSAQEHEIGPVLKGKIGHGFSYETGYRAGISEGAADHNVKFFLSKTF